MGIGYTVSGNLSSTERFLKEISANTIFDGLERFGQQGVDALSAATPKDSGITADSWYYEILKEKNTYSIIWGNNHVVEGRPIAVLIQLGHGTKNGGYVPPRDYINPALRPIFDQLEAAAWKAVTS